MPPEVAFADLQFIIEFVYRGEIDVSEAELQVSRFTHINWYEKLDEEPPCVDLENDGDEKSLKIICETEPKRRK